MAHRSASRVGYVSSSSTAIAAIPSKFWGIVTINPSTAFETTMPLKITSHTDICGADMFRGGHCLQALVNNISKLLIRQAAFSMMKAAFSMMKAAFSMMQAWNIVST